jgi:hypothetical protein
MKLLNRKGMAVLPIVVAVLIAAVAIYVGVIVFSKLDTSITKTDYSVDAQKAMNTTASLTWTSFGILPLVILILAAVAVIGAVMLLGGGRE